MDTILEAYYAKFEKLIKTVEADDASSTKPHAGHGFWDHDIAVAMTATQFCSTQKNADMVFVAGLIHSTDRKVDEADYPSTLSGYLALVTDFFTQEEVDTIREAVNRHDEYRDTNVETRSEVQKALMDADKIMNLQALVIVRSGQFHPGIPAVEPEFIGHNAVGQRYNNPASTFLEPTSILENLRSFVEWSEPGWIHSAKAQSIVMELAHELELFIARAEEVYVRLGITQLLSARSQ